MQPHVNEWLPAQEPPLRYLNFQTTDWSTVSEISVLEPVAL